MQAQDPQGSHTPTPAGGHSPATSHDREHGSGEHGGSGKYIAVFFSLCLLTSASIFATSSWWPFEAPMYKWVFMMSVSCAKALLVMLFFMHLIWEASWKWVLTIPAACMSLFLVMMLIPDIGLRTRNYSEERWTSAAYPTSAIATHADDHHDGSAAHADHSDLHEHHGDHSHGTEAHDAAGH